MNTLWYPGRRRLEREPPLQRRTAEQHGSRYSRARLIPSIEGQVPLGEDASPEGLTPSLANRDDAEMTDYAVQRGEVAGLPQDQGSSRAEVQRVGTAATAGTWRIRQHDLSRQPLIRGRLCPVTHEKGRVAVGSQPALKALVSLGARRINEGDPSLGHHHGEVGAVTGRWAPGKRLTVDAAELIGRADTHGGEGVVAGKNRKQGGEDGEEPHTSYPTPPVHGGTRVGSYDVTFVGCGRTACLVVSRYSARICETTSRADARPPIDRECASIDRESTDVARVRLPIDREGASRACATTSRAKAGTATDREGTAIDREGASRACATTSRTKAETSTDREGTAIDRAGASRACATTSRTNAEASTD